MTGVTAEMKEAMHPRSIVARAVAENGVVRQIFAQPHHYRTEVDAARLLGRFSRPFQEAGMRDLGIAALRLFQFEMIEPCGKRRRRGVDGEVRAVNPAELFGARMNMNERHLRARNIE